MDVNLPSKPNVLEIQEAPGCGCDLRGVMFTPYPARR